MPLKAAIPRENMRLVRAGVVAVLGLLCMSAVYPSRLTAADIAGSWCFVEQSGFGQSVEEKIEIHFSQDGHYTWTEDIPHPRDVDAFCTGPGNGQVGHAGDSCFVQAPVAAARVGVDAPPGQGLVS